MFSRLCFNTIRRVESSLYGGPETVEHNYERDGKFQAERTYRRGNGDNNESQGSQSTGDIWYSLVFNPETHELLYVFSEDD